MRMLRYMVLGVMMLFSGCLKVDYTLTIKKDGSGSAEINYSLTEQAIVQVKAMEKLEKGMARVSDEKEEKKKERDDLTRLLFKPNEEKFKELFRPYVKNGIVIESLKIDSRGIWRHIHIKVLFKNVADLAKTEFFPEFGFSISRDKTGDYELRHDSMTEKDAKKTEDASDKETAKLLKPIFAGFNVVMRVNVPEKIVRTNAARKSLYQAEWTYDFDSDPQAFTKLCQQDFFIFIEGKDLILPKMNQTE